MAVKYCPILQLGVGTNEQKTKRTLVGTHFLARELVVQSGNFGASS